MNQCQPPGVISGFMSPDSLAHSQRYTDALGWASQLHRYQRRKGKPVPYISHLIAVSALVWEDGGTENQAIAALLHDAIEDAGQSHGLIQGRFGTEVAGIVLACTDTAGPVEPGGEKEPWLGRKTRFLEELPSKPASSWLVIAADKAHNTRDLMIDTKHDPTSWERFSAGLEGSCWYLWSIHRQLQSLLPASRSVGMLGSCLNAILNTEAVQSCLQPGQSVEAWAEGYLARRGVHSSPLP